MKSWMKFLIFFLFFSLYSLAEETKTEDGDDLAQKLKNAASDTVESVKVANEKVQTELGKARTIREQHSYFTYLNYSPIDLIIPSKYGLTLGLNRKNPDLSWEFEYLRGSFSIPSVIKDLGKMIDERYSLIRRNYMGGNSFNISYGLTFFSFSATLGDKFLNSMNASYPSIDLLELQSVGFNFGVGNRWNFNKNFSFGVDWFSWAQPVYTTKDKSDYLDHVTDPEDKDDVEKAKKLIAYFPRLTFLKLQIGILF